MAEKSDKSIGGLVLNMGVIGTVLFFFAMFIATALDGLPGNEARYSYPNYHPIRWMAMRAGFLISIAGILFGFVLIEMKKNQANDAAGLEKVTEGLTSTDQKDDK